MTGARLGLLLVVGLVGVGGAAVGQDARELTRRFEALETDGFTGTVLVFAGRRPLLDRSAGLADRGGRVPCSSKTLYDVGSVAKQFTAAAVLRLEEQGRLTTGDAIAKFVPDAPQAAEAITIAQLLSHTSGIAKGYDLEGVDLRSRDAMVAGVLAAPLANRPGSTFEYSNANYFLLAAIIEIASGATYEDYLRAALFEPLGMKSTGFTRDRKLDGKRAAHRYRSAEDVDGVGTSIEFAWSWGFRGATGIVSSAEDMIRWGRALLDGKILSDASRAKLFTPVLDRYACGWYVLERGQTTEIVHSGDALGAHAYLALYPREDLVVVILTNEDGMHHWNAANALRPALLGGR